MEDAGKKKISFYICTTGFENGGIEGILANVSLHTV